MEFSFADADCVAIFNIAVDSDAVNAGCKAEHVGLLLHPFAESRVGTMGGNGSFEKIPGIFHADCMVDMEMGVDHMFHGQPHAADIIGERLLLLGIDHAGVDHGAFSCSRIGHHISVYAEKREFELGYFHNFYRLNGLMHSDL